MVPASLAIVGMAIGGAFGPPTTSLGIAGWWLALVGQAFGGTLGAWFWCRRLPVPTALDDAFSPWRWALVAIHVGVVVLGMSLMIAAWARA